MVKIKTQKVKKINQKDVNMMFSTFLDSVGNKTNTKKRKQEKFVSFENKFKNFKFDKNASKKMAKLAGTKSPSSEEEEYQKQTNPNSSESDSSGSKSWKGCQEEQVFLTNLNNVKNYKKDSFFLRDLFVGNLPPKRQKLDSSTIFFII